MKANIDFRKLIPIIQAFGLIGIFLLVERLDAQDGGMKNKPDIKIRVEKKTDDKGNIVQYDSSYTYKWSGDAQNIGSLDSILNDFRNSTDKFHFFESNPFVFSDPDFSFDIDRFDSSVFDSSYNFNGSSYYNIDDIMKRHQAMIERFFKYHSIQNEPAFKSPDSQDEQKKATPKEESLNKDIQL
jgi:hypothetical protein